MLGRIRVVVEVQRRPIARYGTPVRVAPACASVDRRRPEPRTAPGRPERPPIATKPKDTAEHAADQSKGEPQGIPVIGTGKVSVLAKQRGLILSVRKQIDRLVAASHRLSERLIAQLLYPLRLQDRHRDRQDHGHGHAGLGHSEPGSGAEPRWRIRHLALRIGDGPAGVDDAPRRRVDGLIEPTPSPRGPKPDATTKSCLVTQTKRPRRARSEPRVTLWVTRGDENGVDPGRTTRIHAALTC